MATPPAEDLPGTDRPFDEPDRVDEPGAPRRSGRHHAPDRTERSRAPDRTDRNYPADRTERHRAPDQNVPPDRRDDGRDDGRDARRDETARIEPEQQPSPTAGQTAEARSAVVPMKPKLRPTRISGTWAAVIIAAVVLIFLLIFIMQNLATVTVNLLGFSWSMPLGVAMLFAAIAGAILVALVGTARILQLRRYAKRLGTVDKARRAG
jgi:uncharacterized integral membrane protein